MKKFISLEEFLVLSDIDRPFEKSLTGSQWIWLYNRAKKSFEMYGKSGPPINSEITTLFNGHGGNGGNVRTLTHYDDPLWFVLIRPDGRSLVRKETWWREIVPGKLPFRGPESIPWL